MCLLMQNTCTNVHVHTDVHGCRTRTHMHNGYMLGVMEHERADRVSSYLVGTSSVEILKFPIRPRRHNNKSRY